MVFHILWDSTLTWPNNGNVPDSLITQQMRVLNDAYRATAGSYAANGQDVRIELALAAVHRISNPYWFHNLDICLPGTSLSIYTALDSVIGATLLVDSSKPWDHNKFMNVITHGANAGHNATMYPWDAAAFPWFDYVRYSFTNFSSDSARRILAHEIAHWMALHHVNFGLCSASCTTSGLTTGDLIFDTEYTPCGAPFDCPTGVDSLCALPSVVKFNFMVTSASSCMQRFTRQQAGRIRCGLETYHCSAYLGIDESSITATVTTFCSRGNQLVRAVITWDTNVATTGTDTLQVWGPSVQCGGATPSIDISSPNGVHHSVTYQGPCNTGTFKYTIRSRNGDLGTRAECRTFSNSSCPSCPACDDPPCEFE